MATERLLMRHIRDILRVKWTLRRTHREAARSLGVSLGAVASVVSRASAKGLTWDGVAALSDEALEEILYGPKLPAQAERPAPDPVWIHTELRGAGVTLELLHLEYLATQKDGYRYSAFCAHYRRWLERRRLSMRQVHKAGEKAFVDYSGQKPHLVDPDTGELIEVELFVAVLGASNYTYAEATATQRTDDFILGHVHAVEYFGGVPAVVVPDQLRTGIGQPCRYEPTLQQTYAEWARHYGTAVVPARPAKPRDKAKVEVGVQVVQRWILARLRHEVFFSLPPLNARIRELLGELNARPMKTYGGQSRRDLFERFDRPALQPLPPEHYVYGEWSQARANVDYHVEVKRHYYSVPHPLIHRLLDVRVSASSVEIFDRGMRVCVHRRHDTPGRHTTIAEHMPKAHRAHLEWSPSRLVQWGATIGAQTAALIEAILADRPHPEQGYRSCLGLLRLGKQYGADRLEAACGRAASGGATSYRHVQSILKHGLDRQPLLGEGVATVAPLMHANVRGPRYYDDPEGEH
jgi:transposase